MGRRMTLVVQHPLACVLAASLFAVALGGLAALLPDRYDR